MKLNKGFSLFIIGAVLASLLLSSCNTKKRDCRGRKKQVKTNMGGWL